MASEKITAIVEEIKGLTILELNELVKAVEEAQPVVTAETMKTKKAMHTLLSAHMAVRVDFIVSSSVQQSIL